MNKLVDLHRRRVLGGLSGLAGTMLLSGCDGGVGPGASARTGSFAPRGLHLSLTGDVHSSRSVTWFTDGLEAPPSMLQFDTVEPGMSPTQIQQQPLRFFSEGSADATPGVEAFTHRATATGIDPEKPLRYRVGSAAGWSSVRVVMPSPTESWRFAHFGDHGLTPLARQTLAAVAHEPLDLLMLAGDLSYANGNQPIWDDWFDQMDPLFSRIPTMAAPGNHEEEDDAGNTFKNRFFHPNAPTAAVTGSNPGSSFYAFDYNRVHFLISTAGALIGDGTLPEELVNIEVDLATAAARRLAGQIDFIVVMQHFTIWTDQEGRSPANPSLVALEENILVRYGVDLLIDGHDHVYQRSQPMAFGQPNPLGYVQMMVGTGGQSIRLFDDDGPQAWSQTQFVGIGYATYDVSPGRIRGRFVGAPPIDTSDELRQTVTAPFALIDEFEIARRGLLACRECALPPRPAEVLLANFDAVARHTRERNRLALQHCA